MCRRTRVVICFASTQAELVQLTDLLSNMLQLPARKAGNYVTSSLLARFLQAVANDSIVCCVHSSSTDGDAGAIADLVEMSWVAALAAQ